MEICCMQEVYYVFYFFIYRNIFPDCLRFTATTTTKTLHTKSPVSIANLIGCLAAFPLAAFTRKQTCWLYCGREVSYTLFTEGGLFGKAGVRFDTCAADICSSPSQQESSREQVRNPLPCMWTACFPQFHDRGVKVPAVYLSLSLSLAKQSCPAV